MDTISLWEAVSDQSVTYPELTETIEADIAIVGGGITGITAALELINAGKKVALVEAHQIGSGTTGFSTGNLYVATQPYFQNILSKFNLQTASQIAHSRLHIIDYIETNVRNLNIPCFFTRRPWYIYSQNKKQTVFLEKEINTYKKMNIDIEYTHDLPFAIEFKKAAIMPRQARFNPLQYVIAVATHLKNKGCLIYEKTRVISIDEDNKCVLKTAKGKIIAKNTIIATHTPIGINAVQIFTAPYRSYVIAARLNDNIYPEAHLWDLNCPHHSICTHSLATNKPELLVVAGNHHKTGQAKDTEAYFSKLESYIRKNFSVSDIAYRWSAQHYQSADDVPYMGLAHRNAKYTYMATGFFADGLVYGTLAGILLSDLILKKENPLNKIYNSNRFTPVASAEFILKESSNVFLQYLTDFPWSGEKNYEDIKPDEAKVVEIDQEKWGIYRDKNEKLHIVSAVCTHMKCILNFNNAEKTWDCPCHGSRFTTDGEVIEGPAQECLKKKLEKEILSC